MRFYRYAAYGSNLHPGRLRKRVPSAELVGTSFLPEFDLQFHKTGVKDGSGKCNIQAGKTGVFVAIFDIAESERRALDRKEGLGAGYNHQRIQIGEFGICLTYVADPTAINNSLRPFDWYKEYVILGARFHNFPAKYVSALEGISVDADKDMTRADREWNAIEGLRGGTGSQ